MTKTEALLRFLDHFESMPIVQEQATHLLGRYIRAKSQRQSRVEAEIALTNIQRVEQRIAKAAPKASAEAAPIIFLNATSSPSSASFSQLVGLITSWGLRMEGEQVIHWMCERGMSKCTQGTSWYNPNLLPPCETCIRVRQRLFPDVVRESFTPPVEPRVPFLTSPLRSVAEAHRAVYKGIPIGKMCLPSMRHSLKRYTLPNNRTTLSVYHHFLISAAHIIDTFTALIDKYPPKMLIAFNGYTYTESVAREVALRAEVPVLTYEVGFMPHTTFMDLGGFAPEYPISVPADFALDAEQNAQLDAYLTQRQGGDFSMGGVRFWADIVGLDPALKEKVARFKDVVAVFTNTVYDTSQATANYTFDSMFEWLDTLVTKIKRYPDTLFIIRAHPDEYRNGVRRSLERVGDWLAAQGHLSIPNLHFIPPTTFINSYDVLRLSKLCLVYNSTIGLEAMMMGIPTLCAAAGKYSQTQFGRPYEDGAAYIERLQDLLAQNDLQFPEAWHQEARRFFYYLFFVASLRLEEFVESVDGVLTVRDLPAEAFRAQSSTTMKIIIEGILQGKAFRYPH